MHSVESLIGMIATEALEEWTPVPEGDGMNFDEATDFYNRIDEARGNAAALDALEAEARALPDAEERTRFLGAIARTRQPWTRPADDDAIVRSVDDPPLKLE